MQDSWHCSVPSVVLSFIPKISTVVLSPSLQFIFPLYESSFSFLFYLHVLCCHKNFLDNLIAVWNTLSVYLCMHGRVFTRTVWQATTKGA